MLKEGEISRGSGGYVDGHLFREVWEEEATVTGGELGVRGDS